MTQSDKSYAVRWTTSDRGFRHYAEADGHEVHESSAAVSPRLWIDDEHTALDEATGLRDSLPAGPWRDTLTIAIEQHYQHRPLSTDWKAGDPCHSCGSVDTHLEGSEAWCDGCGADERADSADA